MLMSLLPNEVKAKITNDDIRLTSKLTSNKTLGITEKSFIYTKLGFTQSHSDHLNDLLQGKSRKTPGIYKSEEPINITGIDKVQSKCGCVIGSNVNGIREPILSSFAIDRPPGYKLS